MRSVPVDSVEPRPRDALVAARADLVTRARGGEHGARAALYDQHAPVVRRVLLRALGSDAELVDCIQETFLRAFASLASLDDPARFEPWLVAIAVHVARGIIRKRSRGRWLSFFSSTEIADVAVAPSVSAEDREAVRAVYAILDTMPVEERLAFALRHLDERELTEGAAAMAISLATYKRRLQRAEERFRALAARHPSLRDRVATAPEEKP